MVAKNLSAKAVWSAALAANENLREISRIRRSSAFCGVSFQPLGASAALTSPPQAHGRPAGNSLIPSRMESVLRERRRIHCFGAETSSSSRLPVQFPVGSSRVSSFGSFREWSVSRVLPGSLSWKASGSGIQSVRSTPFCREPWRFGAWCRCVQ